MPRRSAPRRSPAPQRRSAHTSSSQQQHQQQQQQQQDRHHMTPPYPSQQQQQQQQPTVQGRQPGLFAQMASTAAGVAVGSAVGHTMANGVSAMFGGGSSENEQPQQQPQQQGPLYQQPMVNQTQNGQSCEADAKAFTQCLEATNNDMSACKWYFDALKQCQQMASQY